MSILLALCCLGGSANPNNVLVEGYTFIRPDSWVWEAPSEASNYLNKFNIPGNSEAESVVTNVGFFHVSPLQSELRTRVLSNFDRYAQLTEITIPVDKGELTYVKVLGTALARGKSPTRPNYELFGVMLPGKAKDKSLFVRLFGPRPEVDVAISDFKKMVEKAVQDGAE
jgi:hypothetical protein